MCTLHTRFCTFGADLHAQSVIIKKISASELRRKFIKSALLVGFTYFLGVPEKNPSLDPFLLEWALQKRGLEKDHFIS